MFTYLKRKNDVINVCQQRANRNSGQLGMLTFIFFTNFKRSADTYWLESPATAFAQDRCTP